MKIENLQNGRIALVENADTASEMRFGDFDASDVYIIERHRFGGSRDQYVKTVEFILKQDNELVLLEAKSKTSREYFAETCDKMFDSLNKYFSFAAGRNSDEKYREFAIDMSAVSFHFYLVVKRLDMAFAKQANDTFARAIKERFSLSFINIWQLSIPKNVTVMSYESAKKANIAI
ncbi:MAG: hypothetical protein LBQ16_04470 [Gracilibacteraceae bacterium]|jgi:hypothetical protein|nr:hypothetical protein [Gracilibacteraceae bacterium]